MEFIKENINMLLLENQCWPETDCFLSTTTSLNTCTNDTIKQHIEKQIQMKS